MVKSVATDVNNAVLRYIICLGNPGAVYSGTPHNIGYDVADALLSSDGSPEEYKKHRLYLAARRKKDNVTVVKPLTFMNLSGEAVLSLIAQKKIKAAALSSEILVVCDDFSLPLGRIRCRLSGSDGGHNGLRSIISLVGENFPRLKIGVGPIPDGDDPSDFVLRRFGAGLVKKKNLIVRSAAGIIEDFISSKKIIPGTWDF